MDDSWYDEKIAGRLEIILSQIIKIRKITAINEIILPIDEIIFHAV
jgi:hypothetical protein